MIMVTIIWMTTVGVIVKEERKEGLKEGREGREKMNKRKEGRKRG